MLSFIKNHKNSKQEKQSKSPSSEEVQKEEKEVFPTIHLMKPKVFNHLLRSFAAICATVWFGVLSLINDKKSVFLNETRKLTEFGWFITVLTVLLLVFSAVSSAFEKVRTYKKQVQYNDDIKKLYKRINDQSFLIKEIESNREYAEKLLVSLDRITDDNKSELQYGFKAKGKFEFSTDQELDTIAKEIITFFYKTTNIKANMIGVSLVYRVLNNNKYNSWRMYPAINIENTLPFSTLIKSGTTLKHVMDTKENVFYPSKKEAFDKGNYKYDSKDKEFNNEGSIICRDVGVNPDNSKYDYVQAILTITTYGRQIVDKSSKGNLEKGMFAIKSLALPYFDNKLKEILAKIYLIHNKKLGYVENE